MSYYIVHEDRPRDALRVCRNSRAAQLIKDIMGPEYKISTGPIDKIINREVRDLGEPGDQVIGSLS